MTVPTTPTVYIDAEGIHIPPFDDVLTYIRNQYTGIYGDDTYLANDSQDGQWTAIVAQAISDCNSAAVAAYNSRGPDGAQGAGLSSIIKINGLKRQVPSASTVEETIGGQAFAVITNGVVEDDNGFRWDLPETVTIPSSGLITVTATCQTLGAIQAGDDTITGIATPTLGWQTATNATPATVGQPVETDAQLRIRQAVSTANPSETLLEGLRGQLLALLGVTNVTPYENQTDIPDENGLPGHCICMVVTGGDDQAIGDTIQIGKGIGVNTYGTTAVNYTYPWGLVRQVNFQRPEMVQIFVAVTLTARAGYTLNLQNQIQAALVAWINGLGDGVDVEVDALRVPAYLNAPTQPKTYQIKTIKISRVSAGDVAQHLVLIDFIERAFTNTANVIITPV